MVKTKVEPKKKQHSHLSELAEWVLSKVRPKNDREKAYTKMWDAIWDDRKLMNTVVEEAIRVAIRRAIQAQMRKQREAAVGAALSTVFESVSRAAEAAGNVTQSVLDFPLLSGCLLGDAERDEVMETAQDYIRQGCIDLSRGLWLLDIAERVPFGKKVRDVVSAERAADLLRAAVDRVDAAGFTVGEDS